MKPKVFILDVDGVLTDGGFYYTTEGKIAALIHFYGLKEKADLVQKTGTDQYFFDVNLWKYSKMFQKNWIWMKDGFHFNRYAFQPRFVAKTNYSERKNKCVAMGTVTKCDYKEFIETYGMDSISREEKWY